MEKLWKGRENRTKSHTTLTKPRAPGQQNTLGPSGGSRAGPLVVTRSGLGDGAPRPSLQPNSQKEQYWAARALSAEAMLSTRPGHHHEAREVLLAAEHRNTKDLVELAREHNARWARLEKLLVTLSIFLLIFAILVIYLLAHSYFYFPRGAPQRSILLPNHFTIPILSPFTSVVESESAVVGARSLVVLFIVAGAVVYGIFVHRVKPAWHGRP